MHFKRHDVNTIGRYTWILYYITTTLYTGAVRQDYKTHRIHTFHGFRLYKKTIILQVTTGNIIIILLGLLYY